MSVAVASLPGARPSHAGGRLAPGTVIARRWTLESELGHGASGVVYAARDATTGAAVAVKLLHAALVPDPDRRARFLREAAILRTLRGEGVVALIDSGEHDAQLFLVLERAHGPSLEAVLLRDGALPPPRAARIAIDVCRALSIAHAAGVVHRDLKPANVVVEEGADGERARIVDFGTAKVLESAIGVAPATDPTLQNMVFGTPEYMAPEQVRGEPVDARCDVYACGALLYEMLTGSVPFHDRSALQTMALHLTEPLDPPSSRAPARWIPPALEAVVVHALAREPGDRYESAAALTSAIAAALESPEDRRRVRPSQRPPEPPPAEPAPPARRARVAATLLAAAALLAALGAAAIR